MELKPFDALPANSRIWVFAANRPLVGDDRDAVLRAVGKFMKAWEMKAEHIGGAAEIVEDRFLIVGSDESRAELSGCSIDAMHSWVMRLEGEIGLKLIDRMAVWYRDADGAIQQVPRFAFQRAVKAGEVGPDTPVFDPTISRIEGLREGRFEVPLREHWLATLVLPDAAPAGS